MSAQPHSPAARTPEEIRAVLKADRSPKAIRAALPPEDHTLFDREYWHVLDRARVDYDLAPALAFQERWWWVAYQKADPVEYQDTIDAAERAMDYYARGETPPGAVRVDDAYKARLRESVERGR